MEKKVSLSLHHHPAHKRNLGMARAKGEFDYYLDADMDGGLDTNLGAGCDDWDLYQRLLKKGYKTTRVRVPLFHNEGKIKLLKTRS